MSHTSRVVNVALVAAVALGLCAAPARAADIYVPDDYTSIQDAIDAATSGDTVHVAAGTYNESLILAFKNVDLKGAGAASTIVDASATGGPCLYLQSTYASISGFTFTGGSGYKGDGGALYIYAAPVTLSGNIIKGNSATRGGGLYIQNCAPTLVNNLIVENTATSKGGGIFCYSAAPTMTNNTVSANTLGGLDCTGGSGGNPPVTNCIIWGNTGNDVTIPFSPHHVTYSDVDTGISDGTGNISADPLFVGSGDYHLQAGSPCIDAGDDTVLPSLPETDLDGNARKLGDAVDMGAYEFLPLVADGDGPYLGVTGEPVLFDGSASKGPEGVELTYTWDFGDGSDPLVTTEPKVEHTFWSPGVYDVSLVVGDGEAQSDPYVTQATIGEAGGGQRDDVDAFLSFIQPAERKVTLAQGQTEYEVKIIYGPTILRSTFKVTLNRKVLEVFNPVENTSESVTITLELTRINQLVFEVDGLRADGKTATDKDRFLFVLP